MNSRSLLINTAVKLKDKGLLEYWEESRILLCQVLRQSNSQFYTNLDNYVSDSQIDQLEKLIERRMCHEPIAYILKKREFYGLSFYVNRSVLIPRPETELLVEETIRICKILHIKDPQTKIKIADVGTGCGAIAISIAKNVDNVDIHAVDISPQSLKVAYQNCKYHLVSSKVTLKKSNLLESVKEQFDIVVANLPYIKNGELPTLSPEIIKFEPISALDGGADGLDCINGLIRTCKSKLKKPGFILIEIGQGQNKSVEELIKKYIENSSCNILKDLNGIDRVLSVSV